MRKRNRVNSKPSLKERDFVVFLLRLSARWRSCIYGCPETECLVVSVFSFGKILHSYGEDFLFPSGRSFGYFHRASHFVHPMHQSLVLLPDPGTSASSFRREKSQSASSFPSRFVTTRVQRASLLVSESPQTSGFHLWRSEDHYMFIVRKDERCAFARTHSLQLTFFGVISISASSISPSMSVLTNPGASFCEIFMKAEDFKVASSSVPLGAH